ncbi:exodeoxyribonuclease V subunit alpha [Desulfosarcina sp. OttesenSCG-928-B08]|nr:exodeoxyribonuclease V subunit alpha [Desulfosarcina sp. OttesenSCG-928-B08]
MHLMTGASMRQSGPQAIIFTAEMTIIIFFLATAIWRKPAVFVVRCSTTVTPVIKPNLYKLDLSGLDQMIMMDLMAFAPDPADSGLFAVLRLMMAALEEGSLCLSLGPENLNARMAAAGVAESRDLVSGFLQRLDSGAYDALVERDPAPFAVISGKTFKPLVVDQTTGQKLFYFQKFYFHERRLATCLNRFLSMEAPPAITGSADPHALIDALYSDPLGVRKTPGGPLITRDPHQVEAILSALKAPLLVVSGGPGTGKTTLLANILRALSRCGADPSRMRLAAPTGRAAKRMTESLSRSLSTILHPDPVDLALARLTGSTLHTLLRYSRRYGGFFHHAERPLAADVIVVDEVSMVDGVMMDRFFQAVDPARTQVILLGDKDQLPSVEAGAVLSDLGSTADAAHQPDAGPRPCFVTLKTVYRSEGGLVELARQINAGHHVALQATDFEAALKMDSGNWAFVPAGDLHGLEDNLTRWISCQYGPPEEKDKPDATYVGLARSSASVSSSASSQEVQETIKNLFRLAGRCRILTVLREGPFGARQINAFISAVLRKHLDPAAAPESLLFSGGLIMVTRNDYARGLFNGDVGVVLKSADGGYAAYFDQGDAVSVFPASTLPAWEPAFAMTVHKSQGSEFDDTWLILPDDPGHRLLTREIIYTAATRAARRLILYGTPEVLHAALQRKIDRQTGLRVG